MSTFRLPRRSGGFDYATQRSVVVTFTPEDAAAILANQNPSNRAISDNLVKRYAGQMVAGRWFLNGETVIFGADGNVVDGQHRLAACVASGVPLTTWVVYGVPAGAFKTVDGGKIRTQGDALSIAGEKNGNNLAAVLFLVWLDELGQLSLCGGGGGGARGVREFDPHAVLVRHPGVRASVAWATNHPARTCPLKPRFAAFCHYAFGRSDAVKRDEFFASIVTGENLHSGNPVLLLRNRLLAERGAKTQMKIHESLALTIKAWNYYRAGKSCMKLRWNEANNEPFPEIG